MSPKCHHKVLMRGQRETCYPGGQKAVRRWEGRRDHKPRKDRAGFSLEPVEGPALPAAQGTVWTLA